MVAQVSSDGTRLRLAPTAAMPTDVAQSWQEFAVSEPVPLSEVVRTKQPVFIESRADWRERYPAIESLLESTGGHAVVALPLIAGSRVVGALGFSFDSPRTFSTSDRSVLVAAAQICAQALERARLFQQERAARLEAEAARDEAVRLQGVAESANRTKTEFLAMISHELRTPLNAIGGHAQLMELGIHGSTTSEQLDALARIQRSQRHLLGLINGVLNFARAEAGRINYEMTNVPVDEVVATCVGLVGPQMRERGLVLDYQECGVGVVVRADHEKLRQIVLNLLSNAGKFTDRGGRVTLSCVTVGDDVLIRVADTGIGIPPDKLLAIFDPFVQVDTRLTRVQEGVGLGLAISRDLARGMGGELTVESSQGTGSTFILSLRRASAGAGAQAPD
ncbi:MAG: hypothetical protein NVS4B3_09220 [Gemmatimonadaceae bacterium]